MLMKRFKIFVLLVCFCLASFLNSYSEELPKYLNNGMTGTEFLFTFHPNNTQSATDDSGLFIYVVSCSETRVTLKVDAIGLEVTKHVKPFEIESFELIPQQAQCYIKDSFREDPLSQQAFKGHANSSNF